MSTFETFLESTNLKTGTERAERNKASEAPTLTHTQRQKTESRTTCPGAERAERSEVSEAPPCTQTYDPNPLC